MSSWPLANQGEAMNKPIVDTVDSVGDTVLDTKLDNLLNIQGEEKHD